MFAMYVLANSFIYIFTHAQNNLTVFVYTLV